MEKKKDFYVDVADKTCDLKFRKEFLFAIENLQTLLLDWPVATKFDTRIMNTALMSKELNALNLTTVSS